MILFQSLITAGKIRSVEGEMDNGFRLLRMGSFDGAQCAGGPCFSREAGLDPLMQDLTQTLPQNLHLGLEPPANTSLALPSLDTLGTSRDLRWGNA